MPEPGQGWLAAGFMWGMVLGDYLASP